MPHIRILIAIGLSLLSVGSLAGAQEVEKSLSVEEIVARHEATWKKLEKIAVRTKERAKTQYWAMNVDENGKEFHVYGCHMVNFECDGVLLGLRQSVLERRLEEGEEKPREETWLRDHGKIIQIRGSHIAIWSEEKWAPKILHSFGKTINRAANASTTLAGWVRQARPELTTSQNNRGEQLYHLKGKIETHMPYEITPPKQSHQTDELTVTINAARGCMIEELAYDSADDAPISDSTWKVKSWREAAPGLYFPKEMRVDRKGHETGEDVWYEQEVTELTLNPSDAERRFAFRFPDNAVVTDYHYQDRPGTALVSIWGPDDKPKQTFATFDEYHEFRDVQEETQRAKGIEEYAATLFPDYRVTSVYDAKKKSIITTVRDDSGALIREFQNEEELALVESIQDMIRVALGDKTVR